MLKKIIVGQGRIELQHGWLLQSFQHPRADPLAED